MELRAEQRSDSAERSFELARGLGRLFVGGEVVALLGELGSGKTTFARGLVCGLDCPYYGMVSSPTYVLERVYQGRLPVHHYDAYRLAGGDELRAMGFDEHLGSPRVLILEWADRVASCLPEDRLLVELEFLDSPASSARRVRFSGLSERWAAVFSWLEKNG